MRRSGPRDEDLAPLTEIQERTLRRTQLLKLKAEAELARLEKPPPPGAEQKGQDSTSGKDDPPKAPGRQAKTRRSQADQGWLSEGDRAGAASRRADGTGGQIAQTEGPPGCLPAGRGGA